MSLGWLPEHMLHTRGTPRLLFLPYLGALMAAACLGLAYAGMPALYPLAALTGFAFGKGPLRAGAVPYLVGGPAASVASTTAVTGASCVSGGCCCSGHCLNQLPTHVLCTNPPNPYIPGSAFSQLRLAHRACAPLHAGGHWTLFPSLVSELFGLSRFAANYTLAQLAPALGSLTLAMGLTGCVARRGRQRDAAPAAYAFLVLACRRAAVRVFGNLCTCLPAHCLLLALHHA